MFEKYTERARRTIFFARYEASLVGSSTIESEHILLGLIREDKEILGTYLGHRLLEMDLRAAILLLKPSQGVTSTSVDLPISEECKRILEYAAEEAARLGHAHIGNEHVLLGILREQDCLAARLLVERGLDLNQSRIMAISPAEISGSGFGFGTGRRSSSDRSSPLRSPILFVKTRRRGQPCTAGRSAESLLAACNWRGDNHPQCR